MVQLVGLLGKLNDIKLNEYLEDCLLWDGVGEGLYSVKACTTSISSVDEDPFIWSKCVWQGLVPPRVEVFLWQVSLNKLAIRVELKKMGIPIGEDIQCPFCNQAEESVQHLFISCQFSWVLWNIIISYWGFSFYGFEQPVVSWSPPPVDVFKFNMDGAVSSVGMLVGIGGILRDRNRIKLFSFSEKIGPTPIILVELKAIKRGLDIFVSSEWVMKGRLIIESDCKLAVDWLNYQESVPPFLLNVVKDIAATVLRMRSL
ncbi:uncharacterized protein LOC120191616 [Hibiscus syriacus]|uniref:uncharacterized protein LOC120191616 n=1 Tax=Hibiscus syriacus TaxID=106335 RepID=UPI0019229AB0|nr:uncharacterized protein LOC120191616 [Hibiscus syriacus]